MLLVFTACGGGGGSATPNPNPNPGTQPPASANPPNAAIIFAQYDSVLQQLNIIGGSGSVLPNALVDIEDPQGYSATGTADGSGAFIINHSDLPTEFWINPGTVIEVQQRTADLLPSDPVTVTVAAI